LTATTVNPVAARFADVVTTGVTDAACGAKTVAAVDVVGWETVTTTATASKPPAAGSPPADASGTVTACLAARRPFERYAVNGVTVVKVDGDAGVTELLAGTRGRGPTTICGAAVANAGTTTPTPAAATTAAARRLVRGADKDVTTIRR
jgi:hypothetical protein